MNALSIANIVGTWRVVRSEIPAPYNSALEFFHFTPDGKFLCEYPFLEMGGHVSACCYELGENGVRLTNRKGEYPRHLPLRLDGNLLVMTGMHHGYSSWLRRMTFSERPNYLSRFYKPSAAAGTAAATTSFAREGGSTTIASGCE